MHDIIKEMITRLLYDNEAIQAIEGKDEDIGYHSIDWIRSAYTFILESTDLKQSVIGCTNLFEAVSLLACHLKIV